MKEEIKRDLEQIAESGCITPLKSCSECTQIEICHNYNIMQHMQDRAKFILQIEKMKSCFNCKYENKCSMRRYDCYCDKWEIKE